jgi:hypothetical protein
VLSQAEVAAFIADGFVAVRQAVPADVLTACQDEAWAVIEARHPVHRNDPSTWRDPVVRVSCPESPAFAAAGTQPVLWEAFDQLIGEGRWWRRQGVGGFRRSGRWAWSSGRRLALAVRVASLENVPRVPLW